MPYRVLVLDELMNGVEIDGSWGEALAAALNQEEEGGWFLLHVIPGRPAVTRTVQEAFIFGRQPQRATLAS
jgi:hypothetical protein